MGPYKVDKLAVPQTPLPQQAGIAQAIFKFNVQCIPYRGTYNLFIFLLARLVVRLLLTSSIIQGTLALFSIDDAAPTPK